MERIDERRSNLGMTLIEMMISIVIFTAVMGSIVGVFRAQNRGMSAGSERMGVLQNVRFASETLAAELRTVGAGVTPGQPFLVYGDGDAIAFNADYVTNVENDVFAVYYDPDAPAGSVSALTSGQRIGIPGSGMSYPDTSYGTSGINSPAETIMFFFEPDLDTSRDDDYVLYRQVNRDAPQVVSARMLQMTGKPFFEYLGVSGGGLGEVPQTALPLAHSIPIHGAAADTAGVAAIDSVRAVRINVGATNGRTGEAERVRYFSRTIRMPNAGMATLKTCGDEPLSVNSLSATVATTPTGDRVVNLTWPASLDDGGGEGDAARYTIWRRVIPAPDFGDPFVSIPAGSDTYLYQDAALSVGDLVSYAIAVQDCTPLLSSLTYSAQVLVN